MAALGLARRTAIFLGVFAVLGAAVPSARAQTCSQRPPAAEPTPDAIAANDLALKMAEEGKYVEALALFQKAYDLSPSYVILFNVGRMAALTGDAARAVNAYECHVIEGGGDVTPERRAEVAAEIARLKLELGQLRVEVDEAGAEVTVDGNVVGKTPLATMVRLNPGEHLVEVRGSKVDRRTVTIEKGKSLVASFQLVEAATSDGPAFRFPGPVVGSAWVVTGLVAVSAAVTGSLAIVGSSDLDDDTYLGPVRRPSKGSDIADKAERTRSLAIATDVLIAIGVVIGAAAISFSVVNAVAEDDEPAKKPASKKTSVSVRLGPGAVGIGGTFW